MLLPSALSYHVQFTKRDVALTYSVPKEDLNDINYVIFPILNYKHSLHFMAVLRLGPAPGWILDTTTWVIPVSGCRKGAVIKK